jgi:hypothetical protein
MNPLDLAISNLLSPVVLCFALGALAAAVHSDLRLPEPVFNAISIYLMLAIGLKGGAELANTDLGALAAPIAAALLLGCAIPLWCFVVLRQVLKLGVADAAALAAHYGSVSAVTFIAVLAYLDATGIAYEGFMAALLAIMEVPGIVVALVLAQRLGMAGNGIPASSVTAGAVQVLRSKSILLLLGGLAIGAAVGTEGLLPVKPLFSDLFRGVLCLFLLELGVLAASRARDLKQVGARLVGFALAAPVLNGIAGLALGWAAGLSMGGGIVLATLAASASYIAAPAAVRLALPQANPGLYLTASLAITFPFNLALGIPLYAAAARLIYP